MSKKIMSNSEISKAIINHLGDKYFLMDDESIGSKTLVHVLHIKCGHSFVTSANKVRHGNGCPYCRGNLSETRNFYYKFLAYIKENDILLTSRFVSANKIVSLFCVTCGHTFDMAPRNMLNRQVKCNHCQNKPSRQRYNSESFDNLVKRVSNNEYCLVSKYVNSYTKVAIKNCTSNTIFYITPNSFQQGVREPNKTQPKGEREIEYILKSYHIDYKYQYQLHINKRTLRPDFYLPEYSTFIEFDGDQHYEPRGLFGGDEGLRKTQERDALKNAYAYEQGIKMIRIPYCYLNHIKEFLDPFFAKNKPINK